MISIPKSSTVLMFNLAYVSSLALAIPYIIITINKYLSHACLEGDLVKGVLWVNLKCGRRQS